MKLLRHGPAGLERPGLLDEEGRLRDLSAHVHDLSGASLLPATLQRLAEIDHRRLPVVERDVRVGPCVARVGKVVVMGEGVPHLLAPSALCGPEDAVLLPPGLQVSCVARLGVVVGQLARRVAPERAREHIAGHCLLTRIQPEDVLRQHLDTFAPLGPWLVTQEASDMAGPAAAALAFASECMTLHPGDILSLPVPGAPAHPFAVGQSRRMAMAGLGEQHLCAMALHPERHPAGPASASASASASAR